LALAISPVDRAFSPEACLHQAPILPATVALAPRGATADNRVMRFSIRDLLWLTTLGALGIVWYTDRTWLMKDAQTQLQVQKQQWKQLNEELQLYQAQQVSKLLKELHLERQNVAALSRGRKRADNATPVDQD
jgi:hypothetical protein